MINRKPALIRLVNSIYSNKNIEMKSDETNLDLLEMN